MTGQPLDDVPAPGASPAEPASGPSDPELIRATRAGETSPFGVLQARHEGAVRRLARGLVQTRTADDHPADQDRQDSAAAESAAVERLVTETFAGIHTGLQAGNGPDLAFRAHALTMARQVFADGDPAAPQRAGPPDTPARRALAALPERWQMALWHVEVDDESPEHVAVLLGMTAGAVVALTHRAHQRLRERYAAELLPDPVDDACRRATASVTGVADEEVAREAKAHRSNCEGCRTIHAELAALRQDPAMTLAEALLGDAATAYLGRPRQRESGAASRQLARWGSAALTSLRRGARRVGPRRAVAGAAVVATAGVLAAVALVAMTVTPSTSPPSAAPNPTDANADTTPSDASPDPTTSAPSASASPSKASPSPSRSSASPSASPPPPPSPPAPLPPAPTPRLDIISAGPKGDLIAGQTGALEVSVRNTGTRATALVQLRLRLPRGFSLAAGEAGDGWNCTGSGDVTCTRAFLGVGGTTTATVYVRIDRHATGRHAVGVAVEAGSARDTGGFVVEVRRKGGGGDD